ncbi:hypothetical protein ACRALDRAFT_212980 [Sodiomyces alcalophilus JCM 7366]|uniref:uncharacterized protein n=1 Tax=Sodiomyces alcalophilus JCM 7366 TaxID=591952 RepID=UPI0039B4B381
MVHLGTPVHDATMDNGQPPGSKQKLRNGNGTIAAGIRWDKPSRRSRALLKDRQAWIMRVHQDRSSSESATSQFPQGEKDRTYMQREGLCKAALLPMRCSQSSANWRSRRF